MKSLPKTRADPVSGRADPHSLACSTCPWNAGRVSCVQYFIHNWDSKNDLVKFTAFARYHRTRVCAGNFLRTFVRAYIEIRMDL